MKPVPSQAELAAIFDDLLDTLKKRNPFVDRAENGARGAIATSRNVLETQAVCGLEKGMREEKAVVMLGAVAQQIMHGIIHQVPIDPEALVANVVISVIADGNYTHPAPREGDEIPKSPPERLGRRSHEEALSADKYRVRLENIRAALRTMRRELSAFDDCPRCCETAEEVDAILEEDERSSKLEAV